MAHGRVFVILAGKMDNQIMQKPDRLCPIAMYVGRRFAERRQAMGMTIDSVAQHIACSQQALNGFERGEDGLDVLMLLQLEQVLGFNYRDYKPPVSYFGFLGMAASRHAMLNKTKQAIRQVKKHFLAAEVRHEIDDALFRLRYAPLRGCRVEAI